MYFLHFFNQVTRFWCILKNSGIWWEICNFRAPMPVGKGQSSKQSVRTTKSPVAATTGDFVVVLCFGLSCFGIGYAFGKDYSNTKNNCPQSWQNKRLFLTKCLRANRLSVIPFPIWYYHTLILMSISELLIASKHLFWYTIHMGATSEPHITRSYVLLSRFRRQD